jgi:glyoxylase-like metal-dependent hydrolase (beta-lactamase superfamily II)
LKEFSARRSESAAAAFQKCIGEMPRHAYAHFYLADLSYIQSDYQKSLTHMEQALAHFDFMQELSDYADRQKYQKIESYRQELGAEWEETGDCRTRRRIEAVAGQLADGQSEIEILAKKRLSLRARQKAHYLYFFGNILFQLKRYPESLQRYQEAIRLNPDHVSAYNNAAALYYLAGQSSAALTYLETAERRGLEDNLNLKLKQLIYEALGRPTEGILQEDLSGEAADDPGVMRYALAFQPKDSMLPPLYENCYIVYSKESKEAVIIDPGVQDPRIVDFIKKQGLNVRAVLNTHGHPDHTGADGYFAGLFKAPVCAPKDDEKPWPAQPDRYLEDEEALDYSGLTFRVIKTPGHTPGSVCFLIGDYLFSGDTLFKNDIGKVWADEPDKIKKVQEALVQNIKDKLLVLPGQTRVCPGHGKMSTIADEKANNPLLK